MEDQIVDTKIIDEQQISKNNKILADQEVLDIILETTWKEYEQIFEDKRELDIKSSIILTGIGVIFGVLFTTFYSFNIILLVFAVSVLLIAAFSCLIELSLRKYEKISSEKLYRDMVNNGLITNKYRAKQALINTIIVKCNNNNKDIYKKLVEYIGFSQYIFLFGIILLFFSFIITNF